MEITNNIKGDWTKITNVDGFYELMGDKYVEMCIRDRGVPI